MRKTFSKLRLHKGTPIQNDEGAILAEIMVALLILIISCLFSLQVLNSLYKNRLDVESRDRAVEISNSLAEEILAFKCNRVVDTVSNTSFVGGNTAYLARKKSLCNFAKIDPSANEIGNLGDQTYKLKEAKVTFEVKIRYWWTRTGVKPKDSCNDYYNALNAKRLEEKTASLQPDVSHTLISVSWNYGGTKHHVERLVLDSVVDNSTELQVDNRGGIMVWIYNLQNPNHNIKDMTLGGSGANRTYIKKVYDSKEYGQTTCIWFPFLRAGEYKKFSWRSSADVLILANHNETTSNGGPYSP
jgi:hypothetical protein